MKVYIVVGIDAHDATIIGVYGNRKDAEEARAENYDEDFAFVAINEREVKGELE